MFQTLRDAVEVTYGVGDIWAGIGYTWSAIAVLVGGTIVWFLIMAFLRWFLMRCCTKQERAEIFIAFGEGARSTKLFERKPTRSCGNVIYVIVQTLLFSGLIMIIWIAFASAGFNPWTTAAASLALGIFGTYGCSSVISLLFNGYTAAIAKSVVVGEHVKFHGMGPGWDGRIIAIHSLSVDIVRYDAETKSDEIVTMPISRFLDQPKKRNFAAERFLEEMYGREKKMQEIPYEARGVGNKYTV
jgi:small-conductance mechanosensitive channel